MRSVTSWFPRGLCAGLAIGLATLPATAQRAPSYRVEHHIAFTVGPVMRATPEALPRESRDADGTRWLGGTVRVSSNVPCELHVVMHGGSVRVPVVPGVNSYAWRVRPPADGGAAVRYELTPMGPRVQRQSAMNRLVSPAFALWRFDAHTS